MQKRFIVRLKKNGEIVANSQIITINGLGPSTVTANDFTDRTVRQNITTVSGQASLRKTVVSPEWTIIVANPAVVGGNKLNLIWTTTRKTVDTVSWFAVYPDTLIIYSGPALDNTGKKYNLFTPNLSGNFTLQTEVIGIEQQLQIVLMNGDLTTGTLLARSDTVTVGALQLKVSGTNRIVAGNAVTVKVEGAPYEIVTYTGETSGQITLNDKGVFTGSITENVSLPLGVFIWTFDGSVTDNVTQFTVRITSGRALSVSGPTKVARGKPFTVLVNGEPGDRVKALPTGARLGQPPLYFVLAIAGANAGTAQADISNGGTLAVGTYTWAFEGETSKPLVNYSVTVENFTLSVSGQAQALENSRVEARISGAPREIVTISREGTTPFTRELLDDGNLSLDLNADRTLTSGTYTWEFDGDRTFNTPNPTLITNIVSEYMIFVNDADGYTFSDTYVYGQPINVSIIGAPLENITISKTSGGSVTKSLDIFGSIGHNLNPTNNLPLGIHNWTFTGTVSRNTATWTANIVNIKTLTVTPASPLTILADVAANITVDANPYEIVSSERAEWEVVNITCLPDGTGRGDLFKGRRPPLGSYIFYLTGTKAPNKRLRYEVVVSSAPPPPPTPTYKMRARNGATNVEIFNVNEGGSVKFELETYGATLGAVEPYTISLVGGFNSADIQVPAFLTGTLKVGDDNYNPATLIGFASRVIGITADEVTEGIEYIKMSLTNHPTANVQIAINDTSRTQLAVIRHRPNTNRVREGEIAQFDVITQNVPNGKTLYWRVMKAAGYPAIVAADLVNGLIGVGQSLLRGSFTITADNTTGVGSGSFQFTVATDGVIDPDEAFHVQVWRIESLPTSQIGITAQPISIIDADSPSQDYEITNFYIISTVEQCIDAMWSTNGSIIAHEVRYTPNSFTYNNQNNFQAYAIVNVNNAVFTANSFGPIPVGLQTESGFTHTFRLIVTGVDGTTKYLDHTALIRHPSGLVNYGVTTLNNVPFIVNEGDEIDLIVDSNASGAVYITFKPAGQVTITNGTSSGALSLNVISGRWQKSIRVKAIDDNIWIGDRVVNVEVRTTSLSGTIRKSVPLTILEDDVRFANWVVIPTPNALYGAGNKLKYQVKIPEDQYQAILDGQQTTFSWFHVVPNSRTLYTGPSLPVGSRQGTMFISYGLTLTAGFRIFDYVPNSGLHNAPLIGTQEQFELIIVRENDISGNLIARSQVCTVNDAPITFLTLQAVTGQPALIERIYNGKAAFNLPEGRNGDLILNVKGSGVAVGDMFNYRISGSNITNTDLSPGLSGTFTISSSIVNGFYISAPITITALSDGVLESIEYAEVGITSGLLQGLTANIFIVIERTPIITYPLTSYHGTAFTWSIQNGENNGGLYIETTGDFITRQPQTPGSYFTGSPYGLDGSGNRTYNDGDWGVVQPTLSTNLGTVTVIFYFSNGAIVTKPHTAFAATTTTAGPTSTSTSTTSTSTSTTTAGPGTTAAPPQNFGNSGLHAGVYEISFGEGGKVSYEVLDQVLFPTIDSYLPTSSTGTHGFNPINVNSFRSDKYNNSSIYYTVVFTGDFVVPESGSFVFSGYSDDFMMVWVGSTAVNNPTSSNAVLKVKYKDPSSGTKTGSPFRAEANTKYPIKIVYSNGPGDTYTMLYISGTYDSGSTPQLALTDNVGQFLYHTTPSYTFSASQIAFFGEGYFIDSEYGDSSKLVNRLGMYSTRGVGQVLIYAKVKGDEWNTTGKTYDNMPNPAYLVYDSNNITEADEYNNYIVYKHDIHYSMVVSIIGSGSQFDPWGLNPNQRQFGFKGVGFPAVGAEGNYTPGFAVVGYRLVIKDRNGTTVFSTTSTGVIKDYIRLGGSYSESFGK